MNEEVKAQVTTQYPAWQEAIRESQVEYLKRVAEQNAKWNAEQHERKLRDIESMRQLVIKAGLELPESETGIWEFGGYIFEVWEGSSYERYIRELRVKKAVPQAQVMPDDEDWWEYGYRQIVSIDVELRNCEGADIADALDRVDVLAQEQIAVNERALQKATKTATAPVVESKIPTLEERLAELIREIVRKEIAVAMNWNEY